MAVTSDYRPQVWDDLIGQDHVTLLLKNAIKQKAEKGISLPNAYLFVGPRGTGKTTTARLVAKTLNCANIHNNWETLNPCNECPSCEGIMRGNSLDVKEIDMASNRGIDDVRSIKDSVQYSPVGGRYRIVIMDEAHQMTPQAASALLKILEEPPKNVIFVLATTEVQKILPTIRSRCQVHNFKRVSEEILIPRLLSVYYAVTGTEPGEEAERTCALIAKISDGSVREAESKLSNLIGLGDLTQANFSTAFGDSANPTYKDFIDACDRHDRQSILNQYNALTKDEDIADPQAWVAGMATYLFEMLSKDPAKIDRYLEYFDFIEVYLARSFANMPAVFLKLLLLRMAK